LLKGLWLVWEEMLVAEEEGAEQGVNFPQVIMLKKA